MIGLYNAKMIEPFRGKDGTGLLVLTADGETHKLTSADWYNEEKYGKAECSMMVKAAGNAIWPLPKDFGDFNEYVPKKNLKDPDNEAVLQNIHRRICRYLRNYVWFTDDQHYALVANWIISTYFRHSFRYAPILIFDGVTATGKSTVLKTLKQVVYRGNITGNYSAASIARMIEESGPTMLLDESLDSLQNDSRGMEIYSLLKSAFEDGDYWIRADPKSPRVYKYKTYTSIAISVKGEGLPEDVYNRGIRIGMVGMPDNIELGDIDSVDEDDTYGECSPVQLRTELHALRWACMGGVSVDSVPVEWKKLKDKSRMHFTEKAGDQWYYAYVNEWKNGPKIFGRPRNIASTLYTIGLATLSEIPTLKAILENELVNREVTNDTPEAVAFSALVDLIIMDKGTGKIGSFGIVTGETFKRIVVKIATADIGHRYNEILRAQGNANKDDVHTKTVTAKLKALGFKYRGGGSGGRSYMDPYDPLFIPLFIKHLKKYTPEHQEIFDFSDLSEDKRTFS